MSSVETPPDTQPGMPPVNASSDEPSPPARSSTLLLVVVGLVIVCLSCSIIGLAGLAGYNDGVHEVERIGEITREADINRQYSLALTDVASGNRELAAVRLQHIVLTLGANNSEASALLTQVSAVTATPTATPTSTPSPTLENTPTPSVTPTRGVVLPSKEELFADAQAASVLRDWEESIRLLDILRGLDSNFQTAEVDRMLLEALSQLSLRYLRDTSADRLAEGILLAQRAQTIGSIGELGYEAYIASRYLDGVNAEGVECLLAVREWESVYNEAPQYRDVKSRLAKSYAACGDAYTYQTEFCPALTYYNWSLQVESNSAVSQKRNQASEMCAQATPTPTPTIEGVPSEAPPAEGAPAS